MHIVQCYVPYLYIYVIININWDGCKSENYFCLQMSLLRMTTLPFYNSDRQQETVKVCDYGLFVYS